MMETAYGFTISGETVLVSRIDYYYVKFGSEEYLDDMQLRLGTFFDLGVNQCGLDGQEVLQLFLGSGLANQFERQIPAYICGKSGTELLEYALEKCGRDVAVPNEERWPVSPEYWVGYSLPAFQVSTGYSYARLFEMLTFDDIRGLHYKLQDRDEREFVQAVLALIRTRSASNRLQQFRKNLGLTQAQLAADSGVSLRSIQLYEQGEKDINRAAADTVRRLSKVLRCTMEELLEPPVR